MTREAQMARVDQLLSDQAGVPWVPTSPGLKARTLAALEAKANSTDMVRARRMIGPGRMAAAAAFVIVSGATAVVIMNMRPSAPDAGVSVGRLDPSPLLAPAFRMLTVSADESLASEARELIQSTNQMTRRVVAQLPFTGGS